MASKVPPRGLGGCLRAPRRRMSTWGRFRATELQRRFASGDAAPFGQEWVGADERQMYVGCRKRLSVSVPNCRVAVLSYAGWQEGRNANCPDLPLSRAYRRRDGRGIFGSYASKYDRDRELRRHQQRSLPHAFAPRNLRSGFSRMPTRPNPSARCAAMTTIGQGIRLSCGVFL